MRLHLDSTQLQDLQLAEHRFDTKTVGAAVMHLVTPPQEMPYALRNVIPNRPIRRCPGSIAEVRRPAPQYLIEPVRTSSQVPLLPGTRSSPTFALIRATAFFDGLAPKYQQPLFL